ncbi:hypothetical protein LOS25_16525 [Enterococcus faecium]|nr:hypothetical protein [Enterococcus faecium]
MNHSELLTEIINQIEVKLANKEELFQALTKKVPTIGKKLSNIRTTLGST